MIPVRILLDSSKTHTQLKSSGKSAKSLNGSIGVDIRSNGIPAREEGVVSSVFAFDGLFGVIAAKNG